jgi:hypothetical protein
MSAAWLQCQVPTSPPSAALFDFRASPHLLTLHGAQLTVVPEGESITLAVGIGLLGYARWRRVFKAKNRAVWARSWKPGCRVP